MAEIQFVWDSGELDAYRDAKVERAVFRALKMAGGDGIRAARAESKRKTRDRVRLRAGYLADRALPLTFPKGRELGDLVWVLSVSGKEVPLGEYPARRTRKGVSVEVQRGKRVLVESAFMARGKGAREGVFLRPTKARYPMGHRLGPSVADSMADGQTPRAALDRAAVVLGSAFVRLLPLELGKL
jgi:hypothetical protein